MIGLNRQLAESTNWRTLASAGLCLLFAFLISLAGVGETLAHSTAPVDGIQSENSRSVLSSMIDVADFCHHRRGASRTKTFQSSKIHQSHGNTNHREGPDCNTCCPFEADGHSSVILRSKHDYDWLAVQDYSEEVIEPFHAAIESISVHVSSQSQDYASQLSGLSGAQIEFLNTIRLLT